MIYNGVPNNGTCNNTGANTHIGTREFNSSSYASAAGVGYMYGTRYVSSSRTGTGWYYAPDVKYENGTYTLISKGSYNVETKETIQGTNLSYQHYTCGSSTSTNCTTVRYVFYVSDTTAYYITLTGGKLVSDALSDMLDYNDNSSTIKGNSTTNGTLDYWYYNNIYQVNDGKGNSYSTYVEDTVYCNDRSYNNYSASGWNPDGGSTNTYLYFASYGRNSNPIVTCPRDIDKFTVSSSKGNGSLDYPVGLLTVDEIRMAGAAGSTNYNHYLYNGPRGSYGGTYWWTISPYYFINSLAYEWIVHSEGRLKNDIVGYTYGVRPVISLVPGTRTSGGDGTSDDPYTIEVSE